MHRALFLDRDGIFNEATVRDGKIYSPRSWAELRRTRDLEGLASLKQHGLRLILITNQPDIERGLLEAGFLEAYHQLLQREYALDALYVCPFSAADHPDKKPNPGMLLRAEKEWQLDLKRSFFLGDTDRDVLAAERAGCKSILWDRPYNRMWKSDYRVQNFRELEAIVASDRQGLGSD